MEFFQNTKIDFLGKRWYFYGLSFMLIIVSIAASLFKGPNMGIEFTGGTLLQVQFTQLPEIEGIRKSLNANGWEGFALQTQPVAKSVVIRIKQGNQSKDDIANKLMQTLQSAFPENVKDHPDRVEFVGPVIGRKLVWDAYKAIFGSLLVIVLYVAFRFKNWIWGVVGVMALAHDVLITFGLLVLFNREITLVIVAALLTLAGYSINDTIVIFDRVRENLRTSRKETIRDLYNRSLNETLGRTVNTSLCALIAAACLLLGGDVIWDFALSMTFGIVIGSYSTIFVALAAVYEWEMKRKGAKA